MRTASSRPRILRLWVLVSLVAFFTLGPLAPVAFAIPAKVQECVFGSGVSGTTNPCTFVSTVTSGNLVVCFGILSPGTTETVTFTDTATSPSNTYTNTSYTKDTLTPTTTMLSYSPNVNGGFTVVTATWSAAQNRRDIGCLEVSGLATSSPADGFSANYQTALTATGANVITSNSITPTQNGDFLVGFTHNTDLNCIAVTAGTTVAWTMDTTANCNPRIEYLVQTTAASVAATFGKDNASSLKFVTAIQAFKAASTVDVTKFRLRVNP